MSNIILHSENSISVFLTIEAGLKSQVENTICSDFLLLFSKKVFFHLCWNE